MRPDGTAKVLDFGLAKAVEPEGRNLGSAERLANSPTLSVHATEAGSILGTAAYMSPEQARGKAVDKRTDIWAFAVVLFEMLTARRVFPGDDATDTIVAVLSREPDWSALPANLPAAIRRLLRRSLEKDPKQRIDSAAGLRLEIDDASEPANPAEVASETRRFRALLPWGVAAALALALAVVWRTGVGRDIETPVYSSIAAPTDFVLGEDDSLVSLPTRTPIVFTPDGRSLIIQAARAGKPQLFLRSLDSPDARAIAGTDDPRVPFVSPDGKWVGFWSNNELRKVPIQGGTPTTICPLSGNMGPTGATWGVGNVILFGDSATGRIMRVPAGGGTPEAVTEPRSTRHLHVAPSFLPDGERFLFSDVAVLDVSDARLMVQSLDQGPARLVMASATDGRVVAPGRLAFMRLGTLMTAEFDESRAEVTGDPVAALGEVMHSGLRPRAGANNTGAGMFAVSSLGTLAVIRGTLTGGEGNLLTWATSDGRTSSAEPASGAPAGARLYARISPDGSRAIVTVITSRRFENWIADWTRNVWTPCGDCASDGFMPIIWSPDGRRILIPRHDSLIAHMLDGSSPDQVMVREEGHLLHSIAWLADGRIVYGAHENPTGTGRLAGAPGFDIKLLDVGQAAGRVVVLAGTAVHPDVSPDGHWLAYVADNNVVVQAFPGPGSRTPVGGGINPVWSDDGRTLYYLNRGAVFAADITHSAGILAAGTPRELLNRGTGGGCNPRCHDIAHGPRFLFRDRAVMNRESVTRMDLVTHWAATLGANR